MTPPPQTTTRFGCCSMVDDGDEEHRINVMAKVLAFRVCRRNGEIDKESTGTTETVISIYHCLFFESTKSVTRGIYNWALRPVEYKIEIHGLVKYTIHKFRVFFANSNKGLFWWINLGLKKTPKSSWASTLARLDTMRKKKLGFDYVSFLCLMDICFLVNCWAGLGSCCEGGGRKITSVWPKK